ncbi:MAG TPA: ABC transporter substrate-binding protein [Candidatus Sumerlaeota bacterium]|mgnify:CR=1 FL=1|nr:ABC transporter substrate-binding protein [Candidatus Sumerlaeota bacterium]
MTSFKDIVRQLGFGMALIILASLALLYSDRSGNTSDAAQVRRIAVFKYSSRPVLDDTVAGILDQLERRGYRDGHNISVQQFNAENDMATANTIAAEIASSDFYMVLTASTPCLQVMANANKKGRVIHIFGTVTDPYGAGVGIDPLDHAKHPAHLAGVGTFQPVEKSFYLAKQMYPDLKIVGTPWTSGEACATACVIKARAVCAELGITLLENTVENSPAVLEAAQSLVSRGAQALWVGGDNNVELAMDVVVRAASSKNLPVFATAPDHVEKGALFGLGANYYEVGCVQGDMAADILDGKEDPAGIPVENIVPEKLFLNEKIRAGLRESWTFPAEILDRADGIIGPDGVLMERKGAHPSATGN